MQILNRKVFNFLKRPFVKTSHIYLVLLSVALFSCDYSKVNDTDYAVAKVMDTELLFSEVVAFIPSGTNKDDSILMAKNFIRNWVTKQLLLTKAVQNLSGEEVNINRLVEDYRTSLLIHQYKQKLVSQKLITDINDEQIEKYYEENKYNFILSTPIAKAIFFVVPKSAPKLANIRKWFRSKEARDIENLEEYCITNAKKFDNFDNKWIELKFILYLMPDDMTKLEREIMRTKHVEREDDENYYFLKLLDVAPEQTVSPIGYVKDEIVLILKNKKKLDFENELEKQINEEAIQKNYVKIY
ncbi:peptidyl-prolyl cis-trans isomerase [Odoribacter sp. OttesenSCG-928-G04]|nr:peptidyl-prolyl cis-trans isomerase [Odoribacter sp. OttesenSCG-928-G04]